jgi:hypothetical protein
MPLIGDIFISRDLYNIQFETSCTHDVSDSDN